MNSIVNIGASAYSQVKKLENELVLSNDINDENETQNVRRLNNMKGIYPTSWWIVPIGPFLLSLK